MLDKLILKPSSTAQWQALVIEASHQRQINLGEELESYLVFLLMRFTEAPDVIQKIVCQELLESAHLSKTLKKQTLRDVGDACLLFSGLFPGLARRRLVRISYYVSLGRTAYLELAEPSTQQTDPLSKLFSALHHQFVPLMDILQTMRELNNDDCSLDALQAEEVWSDTGSQHALEILQKKCSNQITNIFPDGTSRTKH